MEGPDTERRRCSADLMLAILLGFLTAGSGIFSLWGLLPFTDRSDLGEVTLTAKVANSAALTAMLMLIVCAYALRDRSSISGVKAFFWNVLALMAGAAVGWALAVFWVPFDDAEQDLYSRIGTAVVGFVSGAALTYLLPHWQTAMQAPGSPLRTQIPLAAVALLVCGLTIVTNRTEYMQTVRRDAACSNALRAEEKAQVEAIRARFALKAVALARGATVDGLACPIKRPN